MRVGWTSFVKKTTTINNNLIQKKEQSITCIHLCSVSTKMVYMYIHILHVHLDLSVRVHTCQCQHPCRPNYER